MISPAASHRNSDSPCSSQATSLKAMTSGLKHTRPARDASQRRIVLRIRRVTCQTKPRSCAHDGRVKPVLSNHDCSRLTGKASAMDMSCFPPLRKHRENCAQLHFATIRRHELPEVSGDIARNIFTQCDRHKLIFCASFSHRQSMRLR